MEQKWNKKDSQPESRHRDAERFRRVAGREHTPKTGRWPFTEASFRFSLNKFLRERIFCLDVAMAVCGELEPTSDGSWFMIMQYPILKANAPTTDH